MAAKVVSFINLKGGVGKTTLALAIGEFLAFRRNINMQSRFNPSWPHWKLLYKFACEHLGASLDELLDARVESVEAECLME